MKCGKAGCKREATHKVILNAADGHMILWSCRPHALKFIEWAQIESDKQGAEVHYALFETYGERSP